MTYIFGMLVHLDLDLAYEVKLKGKGKTSRTQGEKYSFFRPPMCVMSREEPTVAEKQSS